MKKWEKSKTPLATAGKPAKASTPPSCGCRVWSCSAWRTSLKKGDKKEKDKKEKEKTKNECRKGVVFLDSVREWGRHWSTTQQIFGEVFRHDVCQAWQRGATFVLQPLRLHFALRSQAREWLEHKNCGKKRTTTKRRLSEVVFALLLKRQEKTFTLRNIWVVNKITSVSWVKHRAADK